MKNAQTVLLSLVLVVLCIIAFELSRVAAVLEHRIPTAAPMSLVADRKPETPEEHKARLQREAARLDQMVNDQAEILRLSLEADAKRATPDKPAARRPSSR